MTTVCYIDLVVLLVWQSFWCGIFSTLYLFPVASFSDLFSCYFVYILNSTKLFLPEIHRLAMAFHPYSRFASLFLLCLVLGEWKIIHHFFLLYRNENIYLHVYSKCSSKTCNSISTNRAICLACSLDCVPFRMTIITTATNWKWKFTNSILICSFLLASFYLSTACLMKLFDITFSPWGKYKQLAKQLQFRRERKKRIEVSSRHNQIILSSCHST